MSHMTTVVTPSGSTEQLEQLAIETPYSIALNDETIGSSMVLPIGLEEFGVGFLFGQGYIKKPEEVKEIYVCPEGRIAVYADVDMTEPKEVIITSGCGGTGKISREMLDDAFDPLQECTITFPEISDFIRQGLQSSPLGPQTHCIHGCGLWENGKLQFFYEDVGRHNAVDKVLGAILLGKASPQKRNLHHRSSYLRYGPEVCPDRYPDHHVQDSPFLFGVGHCQKSRSDSCGLCQAGQAKRFQCSPPHCALTPGRNADLHLLLF